MFQMDWSMGQEDYHFFGTTYEGSSEDTCLISCNIVKFYLNFRAPLINCPEISPFSSPIRNIIKKTSIDFPMEFSKYRSSQKTGKNRQSLFIVGSLRQISFLMPTNKPQLTFQTKSETNHAFTCKSTYTSLGCHNNHTCYRTRHGSIKPFLPISFAELFLNPS